MNRNNESISKLQTDRAQKRLNASNTNQYGTVNKRCKNEPKEKLSSELLNQLMSNNTPNRSSTQTKQKADWCNSRIEHQQQPSDSVLMNLLVSGCDIRAGYICIVPQKTKKVN